MQNEITMTQKTIFSTIWQVFRNSNVLTVNVTSVISYWQPPAFFNFQHYAKRNEGKTKYLRPKN